MNFEFVYKYVTPTLFIIASAAIAVAFLERIAAFFGFTIIGEMYSAGRLLELAATLLVFVIAVLLRQVRDELRTGRGS
jgi:hypothetical protein